jgi:hypothetical protein
MADDERVKAWQASAQGKEEFLAAPLERAESEGEISRPLRWTAAYFQFVGTLNVAMLGVALLLGRLTDIQSPLKDIGVGKMFVVLGIGVALIVTGDRLRKRSRSAAISAALAFAAPLVEAVLRGSFSGLAFLSATVGLGFLAYVWKELE